MLVGPGGKRLAGEMRDGEGTDLPLSEHRARGCRCVPLCGAVMSYSIRQASGRPSPIRLMSEYNGKMQVARQAIETEWACEPCALPGRRYRVFQSYTSQWEERPWWTVIEPWDDARTRYLKWATGNDMIRIRDEAARAAGEKRWAEIYGPAGVPARRAQS